MPEAVELHNLVKQAKKSLSGNRARGVEELPWGLRGIAVDPVSDGVELARASIEAFKKALADISN